MAMATFEQSCRLCLKVTSVEHCKEIKQVTWDILNVLLLKLNPDDGNKYVICNNCSRKAMEAFKFKSMCLYTDQTMLPDVDDETECLVDLREIYMKENGNNQLICKLDDLKVCRLCMHQIMGYFTSVQEIEVDVMHKYIPEINFNAVEDAIICKQCLDSLNSHSSFIRKCLAVNEKAKCCFDINVPYSPLRTSLNSYKTESIKFEESKEEEVLTETVVKLEKENEEVTIKPECIDIKSEDIDVESNDSPDISYNEAIPETDEFKSAPKLDLTSHEKNTSFEDRSSVRTYQCNTCDFKTKHQRCLTRHHLTHADASEVQMYQCDMCVHKTKYKYSLLVHQSMIHADPLKLPIYKCDFCVYKTKYKGDLRKHALKHTDLSKARMYECEACDYKTRHKNTLAWHRVRKHTDPSKVKMYSCDLCDYKAKRKYDLKPHRLTHVNLSEVNSEVHMYECNICGFKTRYKANSQNHILTHRSPWELEIFKCDLCNFRTKYKAELKKHTRIHTGLSKVQILQCEACDYKTKYKQTLARHRVRKHTDPSKVQMYQCDKCDHKAKFRDDLKAHQLMHVNPSELQMYECYVCGFKTKYKKGIQRHVLTHRRSLKVQT